MECRILCLTSSEETFGCKILESRSSKKVELAKIINNVCASIDWTEQGEDKHVCFKRTFVTKIYQQIVRAQKIGVDKKQRGNWKHWRCGLSEDNEDIMIQKG
ncbi:hypothetical protein PoB_006753300 [Plakobranchus ocellatus]|uniref:Uncharacterized protein n=1 Tax=Plakobranchus ocellatus TaxID=259542 RepID=A0AAV4D9Z4_9GAST|nr:hypothetical protein PoB_006753300 [Plakobranchus ocellatus]